MKKILMINHFTQTPGEKGNGRFHYLANLLVNEGLDVHMITTSFSHRNKEQRKITGNQYEELAYKLNLIFEPGYSKNISLKRFYSHYVMGKNLNKYLKNINKPNLIYCSVPSLDVGYVAAKYAKKNNIKFIIDIQDLWPEAFKMVFNIPIVSNIIFYPMMRKANYIYKSADEIIAVSETYAKRAKSVNNKCVDEKSVFLGTDLSIFDDMITRNKYIKTKDEVWLAYIGTLGHSYDITCVIDALKILRDKGITNIKFMIMGDGPLKDKFEDYAIKNNIYCEFTGKLDYEKMAQLLSICDIAVNPIISNSAGSIINKVGDYAAAGLPVINTQESEEYRKLVEKYKCGVNCLNNNSNDLAIKIELLYKNKILREKMGENNRRVAEKKFDRSKTYIRILNVLQK